ncbi:DUF418 domain-containing protein [Sphingomonas nostoxanthinifaciens]|uniref:DUF418 domain-containing protein n=1 Tax=Sphingomonas nostoxanthinifaciens TaxID=2872652 RepID=UPI001CC20229|nr:DUF418 domain-containing protein [Sphingomonas nostoxanthinifaciens]UAK24928.1 DUF418 domain-containing protein [Sphingomonas nostoxanthinifaciens]
MSVPTSGRILPLDAVRGVAVMGILLMNVNAFAMPFTAYDNPANFGPMHPADILVWAVELVLVDGKMRALFSALFGASLLLVAERAEASGRSAARVHYARMAALLLIGIVHACLLWDGDILVLYALVGMAAFPLRRLAVESLLVLSGLMMLIGMAVLGLHFEGLAALAAAAHAPGAAPGDVALWQDVLDQIGRPRAAPLAADLALHRGPWLALVAARGVQEAGSWLGDLILNGPETLGLMLLGMAGLRSGFLTGAWPRARYTRVARIGFAIGLPSMIALAVWLIAAGFPPLMTSLLAGVVATPIRWLLAVALAALILLWFGTGESGLRTRVAATGRAALTNYLGASLVMDAVFLGWGLDLYGRVERWGLLPIALAAAALMPLWSRFWLDRFAYGPMEWLWRSMTRLRFVSIRR